MKRKEIDAEMSRINARMNELEQKKNKERTAEEKKEMRTLRGELAGLLEELNVNQAYRLYYKTITEKGWAHEVWKFVNRVYHDKADEADAREDARRRNRKYPKEA